jgi:hypothetical protein
LSDAAVTDLGGCRRENYWFSLEAVASSSSRRLLFEAGWAVVWAGWLLSPK